MTKPKSTIHEVYHGYQIRYRAWLKDRPWRAQLPDPERTALLATICAHLALDPEQHSARLDAIDYALRKAAREVERINEMTQRHLTLEEVKEAIQGALDNWDFDAISDDTGDKQQKALQDLLSNANRNFHDGLDIPRGFGDVYDWLSEWASATAADM